MPGFRISRFYISHSKITFELLVYTAIGEICVYFVFHILYSIFFSHWWWKSLLVMVVRNLFTGGFSEILIYGGGERRVKEKILVTGQSESYFWSHSLTWQRLKRNHSNKPGRIIKLTGNHRTASMPVIWSNMGFIGQILISKKKINSSYALRLLIRKFFVLSSELRIHSKYMWDWLSCSLRCTL